MNTNDPGREPEPTDAELPSFDECERAVMAMDATPLQVFIYDNEPAGEDCSLAFRAGLFAVIKSGARPMPDDAKNLCVMVGHSVRHGGYCVFEEVDEGEYCKIKGPYETRELAEAAMREADTPAPDEVAQPALGEQCMHGQLKRQCLACELEGEVTRITRDNSNLRAEVLRVTHAYEQVCMGIQKLRDAADVSTARVAALERENAALGAERDRLKAVGDDLFALAITHAVMYQHKHLLEYLHTAHAEQLMAWERLVPEGKRTLEEAGLVPAVSAGKEAPDADTDKQRDDASGLGDVSIDELIGGNS